MSGKTYISPGVYNEVVDNSEFTPQVVVSKFASIQPFFSDKGIDNTIVRMDSQPTLLRDYGIPSCLKYDDLGHLAAIKFTQGGLGTYACRLTAGDALKADTGLAVKLLTAPVQPAASVYYKAGDAYTAGDLLIDVDAGIKYFIVTADIEAFEEKLKHAAGKTQEIFEVRRVTLYDDTTDIITKNLIVGETVFEYQDANKNSVSISTIDATGALGAAAVAPITSTQDDFFDLPKKFLSMVSIPNGSSAQAGDAEFSKFSAIGSGEFYNGMYITLTTNDQQSEKNAGVETLQFDIFEYTKDGIARRLTNETGAGTFAENTGSDLRSTEFSNSIPRFAKSITYRDMTNVSEQGSMTAAELANFTASTGAILTALDGFFVEAGETDFKNVLGLGISATIIGKKMVLSGGTSGSLILGTGKVNPLVRDALIVKFYSGVTDGALIDPSATPGAFLFDMQQNPVLTNTIAEFSRDVRDDLFTYHTGQDDINPEETLDYSAKIFTVNSRNSSLRSGYCNYTEPLSGEYLRVPTFLLALSNMSRSINNSGIDRVHAGYDEEGIVTGFKEDTVNYTPTKPYQDRLNAKSNQLSRAA